MTAAGRGARRAGAGGTKAAAPDPAVRQPVGQARPRPVARDDAPPVPDNRAPTEADLPVVTQAPPTAVVPSPREAPLPPPVLAPVLEVPRLVKLLPFVGGLCGLASLATLVFLWLEAPGQFWACAAGIGTLFAAGKEAGIPTGIAAGGNPWLVGPLLFVTDLAAVLLVYPFVHLAFEGVQRGKGAFGSLVRSAHMRAAKHRKRIDRYGPFGLFLFLIVPFAFNSPLLGIAIGRVTGMRTPQILAAVVGAIFATSAGWTVLYSFVFREELRAPFWVPLTVSLAITAAACTAGFIGHRREKRRLALLEGGSP